MDDTDPAAARNSAVFGENISRMCCEREPNDLTPKAKSKSWARVASFEAQAIGSDEERDDVDVAERK